MRCAAFVFSPLVHLGEVRLPHIFARTTAVMSKRGRSFSSCLAIGSKEGEVDIRRVREDILKGTTPATHFNSAGDSPMPRPVLERVTKHMQMEATLGGYEAAAICHEELESVYESAAQLINAKPAEIALQVSFKEPGVFVRIWPRLGVARTASMRVYECTPMGSTREFAKYKLVSWLGERLSVSLIRYFASSVLPTGAPPDVLDHAQHHRPHAGCKPYLFCVTLRATGKCKYGVG